MRAEFNTQINVNQCFRTGENSVFRSRQTQKERLHQTISVRHGDAGNAVASPMQKNWPLFGQKFSKFGQSIQLSSHVSQVVSIFQTKANS